MDELDKAELEMGLLTDGSFYIDDELLGGDHTKLVMSTQRMLEWCLSVLTRDRVQSIQFYSYLSEDGEYKKMITPHKIEDLDGMIGMANECIDYINEHKSSIMENINITNITKKARAVGEDE